MFKWLINKTQAAYDNRYWTSNSVGVFRDDSVEFGGVVRWHLSIFSAGQCHR